MTEGVSEILVARARELDTVTRPVTASFIVHAVIIAILVFLPAAWFAKKAPEKFMTISLGAGVVAPDLTGKTALGGKKVDEVAPPTKRPEPVAPTLPKSNAIVEPIKGSEKASKPTPATKAPPTTAPPATKPSTGARVTPGTAVAQTAATGTGIGLAGGGQGGDAFSSDWCCPDWTNQMIGAVRVGWNEHQGIEAIVEVRFVVDKGGAVSNVEVVTKSGFQQLDLDAQRAVQYARLAPLPSPYTGQKLTVTLRFPFTR